MESQREPPSSGHRDLIERVLSELGLRLDERQTTQLAAHFALLVHWSRRINLTSVRRPEDIALRHFGESLFLVKLLQQVGTALPACAPAGRGESALLLVDVGSGAGFPGLPIKIACPAMSAVLLEPTIKKAAFLKEVIRQCGLTGVEVRTERLQEAVSETAQGGSDLVGQAALVTLRAVALTPDLLSDLKKLLSSGGRLALFLGEQDARAIRSSSDMNWISPAPVPHSERRVILIGHR